MRVRSLVVGVVFALVLVGPVAATAAAPGAAGAPKPTLTLREVAGSGGERTYEADLRVGGAPVSGADLDIGGLGDDPDLRVATQKMPASGSAYRATLRFSSGGDWVLVVRAHAPVQIVELFTVKIGGIPVADHATAAASPSRRALLRLAPPPSSEATSAHGGSGTVVATGPPRTFDLEASLIRALHSLGAVAWLVSVLGLVLANRLGPGWGRNQLTAFIAQRYTMLAGLGLGVVVFTGLINMQRSSAGLLQPTELLRSGLGTAYLCVFAVKMVAVAASLLTSARIGRLLSGRGYGTRSVASAFTLASFTVTAFPAEAVPGTVSPSAAPPTMTASSQARLFRLAETNVAIGGFILVAVAILGQLHPLLH